MEEAYSNDIEHNIKADIFTSWLYLYSDEDSDEHKIYDLSKKFNTDFKTVIKSIYSELKNDYLKTLNKNQLKGILNTLSLHKESISNQIQIEIIQEILNERKSETN